MPGALKAKGVFRQNLCNAPGESHQRDEGEYLNVETKKFSMWNATADENGKSHV